MISDSYESSPEFKKEIHARHRLASEAMMRLIVLRDAADHREPNLDPESFEDSLRRELFSLQHQSLQIDPDGEFLERKEPTLAETMLDPHLANLSLPGRPLTHERLIQIDPVFTEIVEKMDREGIGWPEDGTVFHDVLPEDFDDFAFGRRLVEKGRAYYNNFPAIIAAEPDVPEDGESMFQFMNRTRAFQYASKPYLIRAHALQPEFMGALQQAMSEANSMGEWVDRLTHAVTEEDPDPADQILLRASRLAYQFLINLMRTDDLRTQGRVLTMSMQEEITDPFVELWT